VNKVSIFVTEKRERRITENATGTEDKTEEQNVTKKKSESPQENSIHTYHTDGQCSRGQNEHLIPLNSIQQ